MVPLRDREKWKVDPCLFSEQFFSDVAKAFFFFFVRFSILVIACRKLQFTIQKNFEKITVLIGLLSFHFTWLFLTAFDDVSLQVDSQLACMMSESSVDYIARFNDLAQELAVTEPSLPPPWAWAPPPPGGRPDPPFPLRSEEKLCSEFPKAIAPLAPPPPTLFVKVQ